MPSNIKRFCKIVSALVIISLVACALIISFPHGHECLGLDCAVCNVMDSSRDILLVIVLLSIAQFLLGILFVFSFARERITLFSEKTPVGLKVKLSN